MKQLENYLVIHHNKDLDGIASRLVFEPYCDTIVGANYTDDILEDVEVIKGYNKSNIIFVDITPNINVLKELIKTHGVLIIDHHETAYNEYSELGIENFIYYYSSVDCASLMAYKLLCDIIPSYYETNLQINVSVFLAMGISLEVQPKVLEFYELISDYDLFTWVNSNRISALILNTFTLNSTIDNNVKVLNIALEKYIMNDCINIDFYMITAPLFEITRVRIFKKQKDISKVINIEYNSIKFVLAYGVMDYFLQAKLFKQGEIIASYCDNSKVLAKMSFRTRLENIHLGDFLKQNLGNGGGGHKKAGGTAMSLENFVVFINTYNTDSLTFETYKDIRNYLAND